MIWDRLKSMTYRAAQLVNLALLCLFPLAWQAPLAHAEATWFFSSDSISIFSGVAELYERDFFLCVIVVLFAIVAPFVKTVALVYAQFSDHQAARAMLPTIELFGRLSMVDVFLIAFYVIAYRGVGEIVIDWGLYLFTGLVLVSMWASWITMRRRFVVLTREEVEARASELASARLQAATAGPLIFRKALEKPDAAYEDAEPRRRLGGAVRDAS